MDPSLKPRGKQLAKTHTGQARATARKKQHRLERRVALERRARENGVTPLEQELRDRAQVAEKTRRRQEERLAEERWQAARAREAERRYRYW